MDSTTPVVRKNSGDETNEALSVLQLNSKHLINAMRNRDIQECKRLLEEKDFDVNYIDEDGFSVLEWAVASENSGICELFLQREINQSFKNKAFDIAIYRSLVEICQLLLQSGIDADYKAQALFKAITNSNFEVCKLLLDSGGIDQDFKCELFLDAIRKKNYESCELLLQYLDDVNFVDLFGESPLSYATEGGNIQICQLLLQSEIDANSKNEAFFKAITNGNFAVCELLLQSGIDEDFKNEAFLNAVGNGNHDLCELLLQSGIDANYKSGFLPDAIKQGNHDLCKLLLQSGIDANYKNEAFLDAIRDEKYDLCELLLQSGIDENSKNEALLDAVVSSNFTMCKFLLQNGADINCQEWQDSRQQEFGNILCRIVTDLDEKTPDEVFEICEFLLSNGFDISKLEEGAKKRIMHLAAENFFTKVYKHLLLSGFPAVSGTDNDWDIYESFVERMDEFYEGVRSLNEINDFKEFDKIDAITDLAVQLAGEEEEGASEEEDKNWELKVLRFLFEEKFNISGEDIDQKRLRVNKILTLLTTCFENGKELKTTCEMIEKFQEVLKRSFSECAELPRVGLAIPVIFAQQCTEYFPALDRETQSKIIDAYRILVSGFSKEEKDLIEKNEYIQGFIAVAYNAGFSLESGNLTKPARREEPQEKSQKESEEESEEEGWQSSTAATTKATKPAHSEEETSSVDSEEDDEEAMIDNAQEAPSRSVASVEAKSVGSTNTIDRSQ